MDQTIEETVNKDTQTPGGTKGFSLKPAALSRYYLTAEHRSTCLKQLRDLTDIKPPGCNDIDRILFSVPLPVDIDVTLYHGNGPCFPVLPCIALPGLNNEVLL